MKIIGIIWFLSVIRVSHGGNIINPECSEEEDSCHFYFNISHRYTMTEYGGPNQFSPLVAGEGEALYRTNCDGSRQNVPLTAEGKVKLQYS